MQRTRCEIYKYVITTEKNGSFSSQREHCINPNNLNRGSNNEKYLLPCKVCCKQCKSSIKRFGLKTLTQLI